MADTPPSDPRDPDDLASRVEFLQYHQPALKSGRYRIAVDQQVTVGGETITYSSPTRDFTVAGERFALAPADIQAVFPPDGSLGDHGAALPHVVLRRSTLPWEREARPEDRETPWLALLLFDDAEAPEPRTVTVGDLAFVGRLEPGQADTDAVIVIDVKQSLLRSLLPAAEGLRLLAHVRQSKDDAGNLVGAEVAVIVGSRLAAPNRISVVHLVSLEGRYRADGAFDYGEAGDDDPIRLVSLKQWRFACTDADQKFEPLIENVNRTPATLRLPDRGDPGADAYLRRGYVPLPHRMRGGARTVSWYHGPLAGGAVPPAIALPARAADELVRYDTRTGLFDVSYAAAWELGRALALQSKKLSVDLYLWKRAHAQRLRREEQRLLHPHLSLPGPDGTPVADARADTITAWFKDVALLKSVPFNYLVPDERMLPPESLRFFLLDRNWIDALLDGAFSIGRVGAAPDPASRPDVRHAADVQTGFLLRSAAVAGWPGLRVAAYGDAAGQGSPLTILRRDPLSANVLLCLFAGEIRRVEIYLKPDTLHFGLDVEEVSKDDFRYSKELRDEDGVESENLKIDSIPWKHAGTRVLDVAGLAERIRTKATWMQENSASFTSAQFALQMIEGTKKVAFFSARRV